MLSLNIISLTFNLTWSTWIVHRLQFENYINILFIFVIFTDLQKRYTALKKERDTYNQQTGEERPAGKDELESLLNLKSNEGYIAECLLKQSQIKAGQANLELYREQDDIKKPTLLRKLKELQADVDNLEKKENNAFDEFVKANKDFQNAERCE